MCPLEVLVNLLASGIDPLERESCLLAINPLIFTLNALLKKFQQKLSFCGSVTPLL